MYNTNTEMKGSKKSLAKNFSRPAMNPRQTGSPSKIALAQHHGVKISNQSALLQLHRRMTIIG